VTTDACVPVSHLPEMLLKTREDIDAAGLTGTYILCVPLITQQLAAGPA
jgi:hypothetical protein